jgi:IMP cyclohydrolase
MANSVEEMVYPGRGIGIGRTDKGDLFVAYFITGRSSGSKNRRIERVGQKVYTEPIRPDPKMDPEIYFYDAMLWHGGVIAVSNGRHTNQIFTDALCGGRRLDDTMKDWKYEPDELRTPRIFGSIVIPPGRYDSARAYLGIVKAGEIDPETNKAKAVRELWPVEHGCRGTAAVMTTYQGDPEDVRAFDRDPMYVGVEATSVDGLCREFGSMLKPDIAVCAAALLVDRNGEFSFFRENYQK